MVRSHPLYPLSYRRTPKDCTACPAPTDSGRSSLLAPLGGATQILAATLRAGVALRHRPCQDPTCPTSSAPCLDGVSLGGCLPQGPRAPASFVAFLRDQGLAFKPGTPPPDVVSEADVMRFPGQGDPPVYGVMSCLQPPCPFLERGERRAYWLASFPGPLSDDGRGWALMDAEDGVSSRAANRPPTPGVMSALTAPATPDGLDPVLANGQRDRRDRSLVLGRLWRILGYTVDWQASRRMRSVSAIRMDRRTARER